MKYETIRLEYDSKHTKEFPNGKILAIDLSNVEWDDLAKDTTLGYMESAIDYFNKMGYFVCAMQDFRSVNAVVLMAKQIL